MASTPPQPASFPIEPTIPPSGSDKALTSEQVLAAAATSLNGRIPAPFGLLTDSVLELKWRKQEEASQPVEPTEKRPPRPASYCDPVASDVAQSDPYAAFAAFLRIAAPTAAIGDPRQDNTTGNSTPYAAGVLARRMLRYFLARRNLEQFLQFFTGEWDNYEQIAAERANSFLPGIGGGHEHIHCSVQRIREDVVLARYYFNGNPNSIFRSRLYRVRECEQSDRGLIEMSIYRVYGDQSIIDPDHPDVAPLHGCEVYWERYEPRDIDKGAEALGIESGTRFVGYMQGGGCNLYSTEIEASICVMDDLLLTPRQLWVADRAFDSQGNFVYGNRRGIPYKLNRVDPDGPLAWTLSDEEPPEGYIP